MNDGISYRRGCADGRNIAAHLSSCDVAFVPPLSSRVDLAAYAQKISEKGKCFEAWLASELIGLVAVYSNDLNGGFSFITNVSVLPAWHGRGIGSRLLNMCIQDLSGCGIQRIELHVQQDNASAIRLYKNHRFIVTASANGVLTMALDFKGNTGERNAQLR